MEPGQTRTIDISDFVEASEIDPIYYQRTYYLAPQDEAGERAYALLVRAMREAGRVGIATFVMRSKQYLAAIRPKGDVLTLETMFFADEIRDPVQEIDQLPADREIGKRDLDMATSLIDTMTTTWDPESYRDTYRERVEELIEAKRNDEEIVTDTGPQEAGQVVDLMDALRASVEQARGRRQQRDTEPEPATGDGRDLAELTKGELYDLAQELDIPGRSSMSRSDLAEAVKQASPRQRAS